MTLCGLFQGDSTYDVLTHYPVRLLLMRFGTETYGSSAASEYFRAVDSIMDREFHAQARCMLFICLVSCNDLILQYSNSD